MDRTRDPYRELGVLRGATDAQVKAAHRRLAKRFHPDAPEGDTDCFLAIQEAYALLSDPLRRRDWDAKHQPGPVRAGEPGPVRPGAPSRPRAPRGGSAAGRWTREPDEAEVRYGSGPATGAREGSARSGAASRAGPPGAATAAGGAEGDPARPPAGAWGATDRDPAARSTTWSAAGVPWWEDFSPRDPAAAGGAGRAARPAPAGAGARPARASSGGGGAPRPGGEGAPRQGGRGAEEMDVYVRSSGAAWSMAARRYFRKGEADLPRGGAWTYRGTQVVTGAEARRVAAEQVAARATAAAATARTAPPAASTQGRSATTSSLLGRVRRALGLRS